MYNNVVDQTAIDAIKLNINGIKKISKERILIELFKILDLKNFFILNNNNYLKEIFYLIFPEIIYLNRLNRLNQIYEYSKINRDILLAVLLIDEKNNHEYFSHKYNISNEIKNNLDLLAKGLNLLKENKLIFDKNLEKDIYLNGKNHLIALNILSFASNPKYNLASFSKTLKKILESKIHKFSIDGRYLMNNGMKEGVSLGKVLKLIEEEWINNNFKISKDRILELIKLNLN
jgi:tRNA nucleotidyltransferase/poly(A) polymerase